jgi:hypothetical protein
MLVNPIIKYSALLVLYVYTLYFFQKIFVRYTLLNKYKIYLELFNTFKEEAFQIIYKDQISGYALDGQVIQGDELETAKRNYIKLCFILMGPRNLQSLVEFYGGKDVLVTNMLIYFQNKIDDDRIIKIMNNK